MSAVQLINPNAEVMRKADALAINVSAAKGLQDVLRSNLGASPPRNHVATRSRAADKSLRLHVAQTDV